MMMCAESTKSNLLTRGRNATSAIASAVVLSATAVLAETDDMRIEASFIATEALASGDEAAFRARHGLSSGVTGGVAELFWDKELSADTRLSARGHGELGNHDYSLKLDVSKSRFGYLSGGYRTFRTWYDGSGGFFPPTSYFIVPFGNGHSLDRGEAWVEAGLGPAGLPNLTLKYTHRFRDGAKDSLVWGDASVFGQVTSRAIVPSVINIDEEADEVRARLSHRVGGTELSAGVRYATTNIGNSRNILRSPEEANQRTVTQSNVTNTDTLVVNASGQRGFFDGALFGTATYIHTDLRSDTSGSRIYGDDIGSLSDPLFNARQRFDVGFFDLHGSSNVRIDLGDVTLVALPYDSWRVSANIRTEREDRESSATHVETNVDGNFTTIQTPFSLNVNSDTLTLGEGFEVRYNGMKQASIYLSGSWEQTDADLSETQVDRSTEEIDLDRDTDAKREREEYALGFQWYPTTRSNASVRYQYRIDETRFDHRGDSTLDVGADRFPAFLRALDVVYDSLSMRCSWRTAESRFRLTGRYELRHSERTSVSAGLAEVSAAKTRQNILGAVVTWTPNPAVHINASADYVTNVTDTPADELTGPAANTVTEFDSDYWHGALHSGVALDENTEVNLQYYFYLADNYDDNSVASQPYGSHIGEHGGVVTLSRKLSEQHSWSVMYGFVTAEDNESGGRNDYDVHLLSMRAQLEF